MMHSQTYELYSITQNKYLRAKKCKEFSGIKYLKKLFALLLVLTMQTVYVKIANSNSSLILNGALLLLGIAIVTGDGSFLVPKRVLQAAIIWCFVFLLIPIIQLIEYSNRNINLQATILITVMSTTVFFISIVHICEIGYTNFLINLSDSIYFVNLVTLPLYYAGQVLHLLKPTNTIVMNWGGVHTINSYFNLLFTPQGMGAYHGFLSGRYTSIYVEAPMCAFMLCIALIIMLYIQKETNYIKIGVIFLGLYATVSFTGYIVGVLSIGLHFLIKLYDNKRIKVLMIPVGLAILGLLFYITLDMYRFKSVTDIASYNSRIDNFDYALKDFYDSPLVGVGFKSDSLGITRGNTSVFSNVLQQGGIIYAIWYFLPMLVAFIKSFHRRNYRFCIAMLLYILMLYSTVVTYTALSISMIGLFAVFAFDSDIYKT